LNLMNLFNVSNIDVLCLLSLVSEEVILKRLVILPILEIRQSVVDGYEPDTIYHYV